MPIGIHIDSNINNLISESENVLKNGGDLIQLFVKVSKDKESYSQFKEFLAQKNILSVVHISYTINCSANWEFNSVWISQFILEIEMASYIGAFAVVVHLGKKKELSREESLNNMYLSLLYVHKQTQNHSNVKILIETSTGQGSEICFLLEDLAHLYRKFSKHKMEDIRNRFGICVDTCHIFAAGYDIKTKEMIESYLDSFNELIGLEHIKLIHLNDSKNDVGSNLDRHDNLTTGTGFIGKTGLYFFVSVFKKMNVPIVLETPYENIFDDLRFVAK